MRGIFPELRPYEGAGQRVAPPTHRVGRTPLGSRCDKHSHRVSYHFCAHRSRSTSLRKADPRSCFLLVLMMQLICTIPRLHVYETTYSLQCVCSPQIRGTFTIIHKHAQSGTSPEPPNTDVPADTERGDTPPSLLSALSVNKCPFRCPRSAMGLACVCFLLVTAISNGPQA